MGDIVSKLVGSLFGSNASVDNVTNLDSPVGQIGAAAPENGPSGIAGRVGSSGSADPVAAKDGSEGLFFAVGRAGRLTCPASAADLGNRIDKLANSDGLGGQIGLAAASACEANASPTAGRPWRFAGFNLFELVLIFIVVLTSAYFFVAIAAPLIEISDAGAIGFAGVELLAAFCGICSVVLCAKGKRSGFLFGLVNVAGYAFVSYVNQYYGEVMLNVLFYIPSNIAAFALWTKHKDEARGNGEVRGRSLTALQLLAACLAVGVATIGYHFLLESMGGSMTMLDGASTVLSIFATILMALRYSEQWFFWIIVDVITVALWCFAGDPIMIAMWGAYLVNAVYGYLMWLYKCGRNVPLKRALEMAARS